MKNLKGNKFLEIHNLINDLENNYKDINFKLNIHKQLIQKINTILIFELHEENLDLEILLRIMCNEESLDIKKVLEKNRKKEFVKLRFAYVHFVRIKYPKLSLRIIGELVNLSHSNVIYASKTVESQPKRFKELLSKFEKIFNLILNK